MGFTGYIENELLNVFNTNQSNQCVKFCGSDRKWSLNRLGTKYNLNLLVLITFQFKL